MTAFDEFSRGCKSGRSAPDDGDLLPSGPTRFDHDGAGMGASPIGDKSFEVADGDRLAFFTTDTKALTLDFLRANPTRHRGQRATRKPGPDTGTETGAASGKR